MTKANTVLRKPQPRVVLYGAFKAMGDFLSAAPVILSELSAGNRVVLLIFPALRSFVDLVDFGESRVRLEVVSLPVGGTRSIQDFLRRMRRLKADRIWVSPHAPAPASSWKIPLILWLLKLLFWRDALLAGAHSERMSRLFDVRVPVDRRLPFGLREWTAYRLAWAPDRAIQPAPKIQFHPHLNRHRIEPPAYDLLIHPGAGAENRKWSFTRYPEFIRLIPAIYRIAVLGLPADVAAMRQVLTGDREIEYLTGTIEQSITSISRTRVMLSMDSGNMFFSQLLGVRTVALFGASAPANVIPLDSTVIPIYEQRLSCQPCGRSRCIQIEPFCIHSITPQRVASAVLEALAAEALIPPREAIAGEPGATSRT